MKNNNWEDSTFAAIKRISKNLMSKRMKTSDFQPKPIKRVTIEKIEEAPQEEYNETPEDRTIRLDEEDREIQRKLAKKYENFCFIPQPVQFLSEEVVKRMMTEIPKVNRRKYPDYYIYGHVDLVIYLANKTYKRYCEYFMDFFGIFLRFFQNSNLKFQLSIFKN